MAVQGLEAVGLLAWPGAATMADLGLPLAATSLGLWHGGVGRGFGAARSLATALFTMNREPSRAHRQR